MTGRLIVGLGSPHGDDQAGWRVISALHARGFPVTSARAASTPADIWNWCRSDHDLTICDANADGHPAGTLRSIVWPTEALPTHSHGTHSLPLGTILELGRELQCVPGIVQIWTISGRCFEPAGEPSREVITAAERLADILAGGDQYA